MALTVAWSVQPGRLLETAVFLDGAVDVLNHATAVNRQGAYPERQLVLCLPAARGGQVIQRVLANAAVRQLEQLEPIALDLLNRQSVRGVHVKPHRDLPDADPKCLSEKPAEEPHHLR